LVLELDLTRPYLLCKVFLCFTKFDWTKVNTDVATRDASDFEACGNGQL